jgi:MinD-like ATPase involved in chromosome partitioning or flagellar assembly
VRAPAPPPRPGAPAWDTSAPIPATGPWNPGPAAAHLRPDELVKSRTLPPEMGWRKAVYVSTGHLVNLGAGPGERALRDQIGRIGSNIPGNYTIAVVSLKGGVGKTRTTAGVGTVYATYRTEPVLALDANPTYGSLGRIIDSRATASIREYMSDEHVNTYPRARSYTGKNSQGLEVLAGNQNVANPLALSDQMFTDALHSAQRFYQLTVVDCGNHIEHHVMRGVLNAADSLVIVGTMNYDGAEAAEKTIDWLAARNMHDLLRSSALVLNDVNRCYHQDFFTKVRERLEPRVGGVTLVPFDKHLRDSAELDFDALRPRTRGAYIELAAWLAQGFATARAGVR